MEEKLYKVNQVADMLDVSEETVRRWIRDGKIICSKRRRGRCGSLIPESEIQRAASIGPRYKLHVVQIDTKPERDTSAERLFIDDRIACLEDQIQMLSDELMMLKRIRELL